MPWKILLLTCGVNEALGVAFEADPAPARAARPGDPNARALSFRSSPRWASGDGEDDAGDHDRK